MRARRLAPLAALSLLLAFGPPVPVAAEEERMYDPVFREGRPGDVLVSGDPPLHRGNLDAFIDLTEASFDLAIPAAQEQALRDTLEVGFGAAPTDARAGFLSVVHPVETIREALRAGDADAARQGFETFRRAIDRRLQDLPKSRASEILAALLVRRHQTAWGGTPEVPGGPADAWLELSTFLASLGRNEALEPTEGQKEALLRDLDAGFRDLPPAARERLRQAHRLWLLTKARWRASDEAKRFAMRWEAVKLAARLLPPGTAPAVAVGTTLPEYARAAAAVAAPVGGYAALSQVARNPALVHEALEKGLEVPRELPDAVLLYR